MKFPVKFLSVLSLSILVFSSAQAATEIKVSCGPAEKTLAQAWAGMVTDAKVKIEIKNAADAIDQFLGKGSDLVLTEPVLRPSQLKKVGKRAVLYLPMALTAQVVVTNLPGIEPGVLKLSPAVLSDIFLGDIKNWNDPAIKKLNPGLLLPDLDIFVVRLSNQNSMNDPFPAFLAAENPRWILKREKDKNIHWPVGQNVGDDPRALEKIRQWAGSIAVVNMAFAQGKHLKGVRILNAMGQFVAPSAASVEAALPSKKDKVLDQPAVMTKTRSRKAYPLTSVVWAIVDKSYQSVYHQPKKGPVLEAFLEAGLSAEGQKKAEEIFGAALPKDWIESALKKNGTIQF